MRKVKTFEDYFEVYDDGILTARLPLTTDQYSSVALHISSLDPVPDKVVNGLIPTEVTMRQGKLALLQMGLLDTVETLIAAMPGMQGQAAKIEWDNASTIKRSSNLTLAIVSILGLSEVELDDLFLWASKFE